MARQSMRPSVRAVKGYARPATPALTQARGGRAALGHDDPAFTVERYAGVRGDPDAAATELTDEW